MTHLLTAFVVGGLAGWILEEAILPRTGPGRALGGSVPFLPIYGIGAALVVGAAPHLRELPLPARGVAYAGGLSALEWVACRANQDWLKRRSWEYEGSCVDVPHALAWGALGLLTERVVR